jgi:uncharacterized repeat protein (TIGR03803 family)
MAFKLIGNKETILHSFGVGQDGAFPTGGLVIDTAGNLFGTTEWGGTGGNDSGTIFEISNGNIESTYYSFTGGKQGDKPDTLTLAGGDLYGTSEGGIDKNNCYGEPCGVVFRISEGFKKTIYSRIYAFKGGATGRNPSGALALDQGGDVYGITDGGPYSQGTVFKLTKSGETWIETTLYTFLGDPDGAYPVGGPVLDAEGNLYGTTGGGGSFNSGTVFKLDPSGNETVLYSFTGGVDGYLPSTQLIRDSQGNLYGTAEAGGDPSCVAPGSRNGCGVVFELNSSGKLVVLHSFTGGADGASPASDLMADPEGNLYGTTLYGGLLISNCNFVGCGVVFKITP